MGLGGEPAGSTRALGTQTSTGRAPGLGVPGSLRNARQTKAQPSQPLPTPHPAAALPFRLASYRGLPGCVPGAARLRPASLQKAEQHPLCGWTPFCFSLRPSVETGRVSTFVYVEPGSCADRCAGICVPDEILSPGPTGCSLNLPQNHTDKPHGSFQPPLRTHLCGFYGVSFSPTPSLP